MTIDYDRLKALLNESTRAPWERHPEMPNALVNLETRFLVHHEVVKTRGMEPSAEDVANTELIALAPDMARELLRLRDGVEQLVESKRDAARAVHEHASTGLLPQHLHYAATAVEFMCDNLTDLLQGDNE